MDPATEDTAALVIHPVHGPGLIQALDGYPHISVVAPTDAADVAESLHETGALITFAWDEDFLIPGLRWVQAISAGVEQFPAAELERAGIVLTSARGVHTPSVAEHAIALLWGLVRHLGPSIRRMSSREWKPAMATELRSLDVAVLGVGAIGTEIATLLQALGVSVVGVNTSGEHESLRRVVDRSELLGVCREVDAIVCVLPDEPDTHHVIDQEHLEALEGWVVNVGRGSTINEAALVSALQRGVIRGAALDVTEVEPLPRDSPLWDMENVIITPHTAWATDHLASRLAELIAHNASAYLGQGDWRNRVV